MGAGNWPVEAHAGLGIVQDDLQQLRVALVQLREARSEGQG